MTKLIVARLLFLIPTGLVLITLLFAMFYLVPGDPASLIAGDNARQEAVEAIRERYGFNDPFPVQLTNYIGNVLQGDFGVSNYSRQPVRDIVLDRLWNTLLMAVPAQVIAMVVSLFLGCLAAMTWKTPIDRAITVISLLAICTPIFVVGLLAVYFFSLRLGWFPVGGMGSFANYVLPVAVLGIAGAAYLTRIVRTSMIEALQQDYVRTARAKGLSEFWVVFKHALRNAMLPIVTLFGLAVGTTLSGSVITETIFSWPGLGRLMVDSILQRDLPVTQGAILIFALIFILVNLAVDLAYGVIDPRVRNG